MAARKKVIAPTIEVKETEVVITAPSITVDSPAFEEVELTLSHQHITSIIYKGIIKFIDGKALVSPETATELRVQRFVK